MAVFIIYATLQRESLAVIYNAYRDKQVMHRLPVKKQAGNYPDFSFAMIMRGKRCASAADYRILQFFHP